MSSPLFGISRATQAQRAPNSHGSGPVSYTHLDVYKRQEETPVGRLGSADEVAQLLVFLAGEGAGYITGQVFGVNGGLVI